MAPVPSLAADAQQAMVSYNWPGNVRELRNICERARCCAAVPEVPGRVVAPWLGGSGGEEVAVEIEIPAAASPNPPRCPLGSVTVRARRLKFLSETILATLEACGGHRQNTARALHWGSDLGAEIAQVEG